MSYYYKEKRFDIICDEFGPVIDKDSKKAYHHLLDALFCSTGGSPQAAWSSTWRAPVRSRH
jgi:hypothetical protein